MPALEQGEPRAEQRAEPRAAGERGAATGRPVMLATLDVPFDPDAVAFALDSAVELGQRLVVANFVERPPLPLSAMLGYEDLPPSPEMARSLAEPARLASSLGGPVAPPRGRGLHPGPALLGVGAEPGSGLPWFGPG